MTEDERLASLLAWWSSERADQPLSAAGYEPLRNSA